MPIILASFHFAKWTANCPGPKAGTFSYTRINNTAVNPLRSFSMMSSNRGLIPDINYQWVFSVLVHSLMGTHMPVGICFPPISTILTLAL